MILLKAGLLSAGRAAARIADSDNGQEMWQLLLIILGIVALIMLLNMILKPQEEENFRSDKF